MNYSAAERNALIAAVKAGPVHLGQAAQSAGIRFCTAAEIMSAAVAAGWVEIQDLGPGARGVMVWKGPQ